MKILYKTLLSLSFVIIALIVTNGNTTNLFTNVFAQMMQQQNQMQLRGQQVQPQVNNQTSLILQDPSSLQGSFFTIDNMTFSHHMASVNGIQMHYVIGGHGAPVVLLHGWPQTWYAWHNIMPALAKNYTVIAPDLRGLGDSSKAPVGYDGKTTAEDIYQLISQLGFNKIYLVGHDIGAIPAYTFAAVHPNNVSKLVLMELTFPGYTPAPSIPGNPGRWWVAFHQVPDMPEALVQGKEREYLTYFFKGLAYNPSAIAQSDIDEFVSHYSAPGGMKAGFEYYKALPLDAKEIKMLAATSKLPMPVLALSGDIYPILGGDLPGSSTFNSIQNLSLATNLHGFIVPLSGHWIPEEQPQFVIKQLTNFFGQNNTTNTNIK
jgi:pimeloyl-ACP methyl ester carboxylesterase